MTKKTETQKKPRAAALRMTPNPTLKRDLELSLALSNEAKMVDDLGKLNARIAKLEKEADALKATLKATGKDRIDGTRYYAVIAERTTKRLNSAKAKSFLTIDQIIACTDESTSVAISLYDL